jgi:hypothetical protein
MTDAVIVGPVRTASGMKALADWMHARKLKLGVYSDRGPNDFSGHGFGMKGHEIEDAKWMASVGVDYLKVDDMSGAPRTTAGARADYEKIRDALNATGRPIFFSTCGHSGDVEGPTAPSWMGPACAEIGNACRIAADVRFWGTGSMGTNKAINVMASFNGTASGPGAWPDPDLLFSYGPVGDGGHTKCAGAGKLTYCTGSFCDPVVSHATAQFGLWAVMAAPLLLSFDLTNLDAHQRFLYGNPEIIAVNQDRDDHGRGTAGGRRVAGPRLPGQATDIAEVQCTFPFNRTGVESEGLQAEHSGDTSADACRAACCANTNCTTWQYNPLYHPRGYPKEPCWNGRERSVSKGREGWVGGSKLAGPAPPPPAFNIWARNLHDGGTAMIFINDSPAGSVPMTMRCDAACTKAAGLSPGKYTVRDLYARKNIAGGVTVEADSGFEVGTVPADAGSVLWKLSPAPAAKGHVDTK